MNFNKSMIKLKSFAIECKRVLRITKRPDMIEFKTIVRASALGMAIIGLIGFIINMGKQLIMP